MILAIILSSFLIVGSFGKNILTNKDEDLHKFLFEFTIAGSTSYDLYLSPT